MLLLMMLVNSISGMLVNSISGMLVNSVSGIITNRRRSYHGISIVNPINRLLLMIVLLLMVIEFGDLRSCW